MANVEAVKMRVSEIAKEHNVSSKAMMDIIKGLGFDVKSHLSNVEDGVVEAVKKKFDSEKDKPIEIKSEPNVRLEPESNITFDTEPTKPVPVMKYYFSISKGLTLGGYKPEERGLGYMKSDEAIKFDNHFYFTDDPDKQMWIEKTDRFANKEITVKTEKQYHEKMEQLAQRRRLAQEESARKSGIVRR